MSELADIGVKEMPPVKTVQLFDMVVDLSSIEDFGELIKFAVV